MGFNIKDKTPEDLWFNRKTMLNAFHIFGEQVYCHISKIQRKKLDIKGKRGFFVGYETNTKGYRVWLFEENKVCIERNLIFTKKI